MQRTPGLYQDAVRAMTFVIAGNEQYGVRVQLDASAVNDLEQVFYENGVDHVFTGGYVQGVVQRNRHRFEH